MDDSKIIEKRKETLKKSALSLFSSAYDWGALALIVFAAIFRYYYLFKTQTQALWFDEATYLVQARNWALGTPAYPEPARDWFVSLIWSFFIKFGANEFVLRFITVSAGILTLYFVYRIAAHFFGKKIGLISIIIASVFSEAIFWSLRLDIGTYSVFFITVSLFFFIKALDNHKTLFYLLATAFALFAFISHAPGVLILLFYLVFIPFYSKFKFYKSKKFWLCVALFILLLTPVLVKNYIFSGGEIYPRYQSGFLDRTNRGSSFFEALVYVTSLPQVVGVLTVLALLVGLFFSLDILLIIDKLFKEKLTKENTGKIFFFILGLISLALGIYSLMGPGGAYFEPRYVLLFYFSSFVFASIGISKLSEIIGKYSKPIAVIFIIAILAFTAYSQLTYTASLIDLKAQSYIDIKQAGLWVGQNSQPGQVIMAFEAPEISYYSGLKAVGFPKNDSELPAEILKQKPRYILIWAGLLTKAISVQGVLSTYNSTIGPVAAFPYNAQQPSVVVYQVNDSFYSLTNNPTQ